MAGEESDTPTVDIGEDDAQESVQTPEIPDLGDAGKKALEAERKARLDERRARKVAEQEREALAAKVREFEEKGMSEQEKLARQAQDAEARAIQAEARLLRFEVAQAKGLTAAQAKYLSGESRKELEARADEILADFPVQQQTNGFVPMFDAGTRGTGQNANGDMNTFIRRVAGHS